MKRIITIALCVIAALAMTSSRPQPVAGTGNPASMLKDRKQAKTVASLRDVSDGHLYEMTYKADYMLQDFIDADLRSQDMLRMAIQEKLLAVPQDIRMESPKPACAAFQAVTPEGDVIYCRNFDYIFKDSGTIVLHSRPRKAYKSLSLVSSSFVGVDGKCLRDGKTDLSVLMGVPYMQMDGMNEKGFAVSVLELSHRCAMQKEPGKHDIMTSVMIRMLLDRAATVDEALEMLGNYNYWADGEQKGVRVQSSYHFLLSDATGKTCVLEYILEDGPRGKGKWVMNVIEDKAVTNSYLSRGWEKTCGVDRRLPSICQALDGCGGVLSEEEAMAVLDSVHQTRDRKNISGTVWSVVYNLSKGTATVCVNHDYSQKFRFKI